MMNQKRVRLLRRLIYAFIIIVLFLPLILMSLLTLRMISLSQTMQEQLHTLTSAVSQSAQPSTQDGYVLEPEGQSVGDSLGQQTVDGKDADTDADDWSQDASGEQPEAGLIPSTAPIDADNEGVTINGIGNNTLNELNGGNTSSDVTSGIDGNPETGALSTEDVSPPNYNGNPGTGN